MQKCIGGECIYGKTECCGVCNEQASCKEVCDGERREGECISKYEDEGKDD